MSTVKMGLIFGLLVWLSEVNGAAIQNATANEEATVEISTEETEEESSTLDSLPFFRHYLPLMKKDREAPPPPYGTNMHLRESQLKKRELSLSDMLQHLADTAGQDDEDPRFRIRFPEEPLGNDFSINPTSRSQEEAAPTKSEGTAGSPDIPRQENAQHPPAPPPIPMPPMTPFNFPNMPFNQGQMPGPFQMQPAPFLPQPPLVLRDPLRELPYGSFFVQEPPRSMADPFYFPLVPERSLLVAEQPMDPFFNMQLAPRDPFIVQEPGRLVYLNNPSLAGPYPAPVHPGRSVYSTPFPVNFQNDPRPLRLGVPPQPYPAQYSYVSKQPPVAFQGQVPYRHQPSSHFSSKPRF